MKNRRVGLSGIGGRQTVFDHEEGDTYDIRHLSGILSPLSGGAVSEGSETGGRRIDGF